MGYDSTSVAARLRTLPGGAAVLCGQGLQLGGVGQEEGGSVQSQIAAAVQFWTTALALTGADTLNGSDAAIATAEIARLQTIPI